jgi:hypothetical protein
MFARQPAIVARPAIMISKKPFPLRVRVAGIRPGTANVAIIPQPVFRIPSGRCGLGQRVTAPAAGGVGDGLELVSHGACSMRLLPEALFLLRLPASLCI